ncbi:unnamed protein product [Brassica rapa subsp. narinosa]
MVAALPREKRKPALRNKESTSTLLCQRNSKRATTKVTQKLR